MQKKHPSFHAITQNQQYELDHAHCNLHILYCKVQHILIQTVLITFQQHYYRYMQF